MPLFVVVGKTLKSVGVIQTHDAMSTRCTVIRDILNAISMLHLRIAPPLEIQGILRLRATAWVQGFFACSVGKACSKGKQQVRVHGIDSRKTKNISNSGGSTLVDVKPHAHAKRKHHYT